jgi:hypothetical protein
MVEATLFEPSHNRRTFRHSFLSSSIKLAQVHRSSKCR